MADKEIATEEDYGLVRISNVNEAYEGIENDGVSISPNVFNNAVSSESAYGTVRTATLTEMREGRESTGSTISPLNLSRYLASDSEVGIVRLANTNINNASASDVLTKEHYLELSRRMDALENIDHTSSLRNDINRLNSEVNAIKTRLNALENKKANFYKNDNGFYIDPSGLYLKWGVATRTANVTRVTFPQSFPNACLSVNATIFRSATGSNSKSNIMVTAKTRTNFDIQLLGMENKVMWFAIGY